MALLHLVRGYPGQGKTTFANTMFPNIPHFENDMFFMRDGEYQYDRSKMPEAIKWCYSNVEYCLKSGIDCVVSNTFTRFRFVDSYRCLAEKYKADFKVYRMMGEFENVHKVPENILKNMKETFEDYDGELYVYPNLNQSKYDHCYRPYIYTNLKVGDKIEVKRFADHKLEHSFFIDAKGNRTGDSFEMENCIATVTNIHQGTYDYLNVHYIEDDTGHEGLCMSGDCKKVN